MKRAVIFLFIMSSFLSFSQDFNQVVKDEKGQEKLLGICNQKAFANAPFNEWYNKYYDAYLVNDRIIEKLKDSLSQYTIKAFFGSWCGDSKREIPQFYKVLEETNFPQEQLEIYAVDGTKEAYKQAPNGEERGLNIHRVPTFIFYKNGKEVNRIVESPVETLERDMLKIVSEEKYASNYRVVYHLENLINDKGLDSLKFMRKELIPKIAEFTKGSRELNTYGYKLLYSNQPEKALFIFNLNKDMFPYKYNVYYSLARAYHETNNHTEALKNYYKVLSINPEDEKATKMIAAIQEENN